MALARGDRLVHYEIRESIGAGGMGEVYRARDTRLDRDVAIKVLPDAVSRDEERLSRFEREAKLLAQLNHPNIATLHGFEESHGRRFLVMELVEGETLAARIVSSPLPLDDAIALFEQIAEGLAAAHDKGIVHRDLKPANIKVGPDGTVKILDFGLAKAFAGDEKLVSDSSQSPTLTKGTALGVVLGTASYMSPEQARGKAVDKRTDLWALGCCLYEALTARRAFEGETVTDTLAAVVRAEPPLGALPPETPPLCRMLLRRCFEKDPKNRFHDAADVKILLGEIGRAESPVESMVTVNSWRRVAAALLAGCVLGAALTAFLASGVSDETSQPMAEFSVLRPEFDRMDQRLAPALALSPDGSKLAFIATSSGVQDVVFLRELRNRQSRVIAGTERATSVFFSPDGEWIGFTADDKLQKVSLAGRAPVILAEANSQSGGSWSENGTIVYGAFSMEGLMEIPASGGSPQPLTTLDSLESFHQFPAHLPDGRGFLFTEGVLQRERARNVWVKPSDGEPKLLVEGGASARYVDGHLLYGRRGVVWAARFDLGRLEVEGDAWQVLPGVQQSPGGSVHFDVSRDGSIAYVPGGYVELDGALAWVDRSGNEEVLPLAPQPFAQPRLSPSSTAIALSVGSTERDVWVYELEGGALRRLTFGGSDGFPVWTPDGRASFFRPFATVSQRSTGNPPTAAVQPSFSYRPRPMTCLTLSRRTERSSPSFRRARKRGRISCGSTPRRAKKGSSTSGRRRTRTRPCSRPTGGSSLTDPRSRAEARSTSSPSPQRERNGKCRPTGGSEAVWARDGRELFYRNGAKFMAVDVQLDPVFSAGKPHILFEAGYERTVPDRANYDVDLDGQRFLAVKAAGDSEMSREIVISLNWASTLKE